MEPQNNPKYPKYLVSLSNTLIKLYSSVKGPEVFHDLIPQEDRNSKNGEVDPYLLLSKVNVLTNHLSQVKASDCGAAQNLACSDSTDYEKDENRCVKLEGQGQDADFSRLGLTMKDTIQTKQFIEELEDCDRSQSVSEQGQIQIKISNIKKKSEKKSAKKIVAQATQRNYWDQAEDQLLLSLVDTYGEKWTKIAHMLEGRTGKQVRDRYINYLRPTIKRREWTTEEDAKLHELYSKFGNKWSTIAMYLNGRTENQVKNRFYAAARKQKRSIFDHTNHIDSDEPEICKLVKTEPGVGKRNEMNIKVENLTKNEDFEGIVKQEFSESSNSYPKSEIKEESDRTSQMQEAIFSDAFFNAIKENQKMFFKQSAHYHKNFSFLTSGATSTTNLINHNHESIELPPGYAESKFLLG